MEKEPKYIPDIITIPLLIIATCISLYTLHSIVSGLLYFINENN
jgi:hypothetical protein